MTVVIRIIILAGQLIFSIGKKTDALCGSWVYQEYANCELDGTGKNSMRLYDVSYKYSYSIKYSKLLLDFVEEFLHDCLYTSSIDGKTLTLKAGEGTDGAEYSLQKE